jgi:hypothetical protein
MRLLVARKQPATREEYSKMLMEPGAAESRDTGERVRDLADRLGAERAAAAAAEAAAIKERDAAIIAARKAEEKAPHIQFIRPGESVYDALNAARRQAGGR